jgi:nonsense-mediated mRNA decay protein 3
MTEARELADTMTSEGDSFVTRIEEVRGGIDFYIGSSNDGRALATTLAKRHGTRVTETSKLVGRKDGKDLVRMTFLVRLPKYRRNDLVFIDGNIYEIIGYTKGKVTLVDITSGRRISRKPKEMEPVDVLGGQELLETAVVVSVEKDEIQVMDPKNYRTVQLKNPSREKTGEEVKIVRHGDDLYLYNRN